MCGITGIFNFRSGAPIDPNILTQMTDSLKHRGPDDDGFYVQDNIGLGHRRLSIIDLKGGRQPIFNEDKTICVVYNGEIFNYIELRDFLKKKGHRFYTQSDTEVIVHLYEQYGNEFLTHLNGQFAIALWDVKRQKLLLARDRVGIRPLFYSISHKVFLFGSEMKSLFSHPDITPQIDYTGIDQVFSLWVNIPPRTVFNSINELPPGHYLTVSSTGLKINRYWKLQFPYENDYEDKGLNFYTGKLEELLYDAVTIRLRADVPVASYLSGGIDSSIISALVKKYHNNDLITFSVTFDDDSYNEESYQDQMIRHLSTDHRKINANYDNIGKNFSDVIRFAEKPIIRTAPAPLYILSGLVRDNGIKVVLTGEGADEIFGGYNIFKEDKIRRYWAKFPESKRRPRLLSTLYPFIAKDSRTGNFWQMFFKKGLTDESDYYSHLIRWNNTSQIKKLFNDEKKAHFGEKRNVYDELSGYIDPEIKMWHPLCRAQYLEMTLFMSGYLLSSQGDRMMMGHSVEGRFPFLDHKLIEFANTIPPKYKIKGLNEKYVLKKTYENILPETIVKREKQPYRAPISQCFTDGNKGLSSSVITKEYIEKFGIFNPKSIEILTKKLENSEGRAISARDDMSLVGVVSLQLLYYHFIENPDFQDFKL